MCCLFEIKTVDNNQTGRANEDITFLCPTTTHAHHLTFETWVSVVDVTVLRFVRMMSSSVIIPGLVRNMYTAGSRHEARTPPTLVKAVIHHQQSSEGCSSTLDYEWKAHGSSVYTVTAKGSLHLIDQVNDGTPMYDSNKFSVMCSCPDGVYQQARNLQSTTDQLYVCKHAKSALDSVCDPEAATESRLTENKASMIAQDVQEQPDRNVFFESWSAKDRRAAMQHICLASLPNQQYTKEGYLVDGFVVADNDDVHIGSDDESLYSMSESLSDSSGSLSDDTSVHTDADSSED